MALILETEDNEMYKLVLSFLLNVGYERSNNYGKTNYYESLKSEDGMWVAMDYVKNEIYLADLKDQRLPNQNVEEIDEYNERNIPKELFNLVTLVCTYIKPVKVNDEFSREVDLEYILVNKNKK